MSFDPSKFAPKLIKKSISEDKTKLLRDSLNNTTVIRVFGFAGTGKGTLSTELSKNLQLPNVESSLIWRGITWVYQDLGLNLSKENSDFVLSQMKVVPGKNKEILIEYKGQVVPRSDLKSQLVDSNVAKYAAEPYLRDCYGRLLFEFVKSIKSSCILDGRGASPNYIQNLESGGFTIVRIFLDSSDEVKWTRYHGDYLRKQKLKDVNFSLDSEGEAKLYQEFYNGVVLRNKRDLQTWEELNMGVITDDSVVLDTSDMGVEVMTETALDYLYNRIVETV